MVKYFIAIYSLFLFGINVNAEVYKWVDDEGNVHYGDRPGQTDSEKVDVNESTHSVPDYEKQLDQQEKLLQVYEEERLEKKQQRVDAQKEREIRKKQCVVLRNRLRSLKSANVIYTLDDEGNRVYKDEGFQETQIKEIESQLTKNCTHL